MAVKNTERPIESTEKLDEGLNEWKAAFNELCEDGVFRPVLISPRCVTKVERLEPPRKIGDYTANTSISYRERGVFEADKSGEVFVFETSAIVLSALGTMIAASDNFTSSFFFAGKVFEEAGIKYSIDERQPMPSNDA